MDAGSNTTFIREGFVHSLLISGEWHTLWVYGVADAERTRNQRNCSCSRGRPSKTW
jgi:hypothetical protein